MADFSAQAVINTILSQAFPEDPIVGEEDASDLRAPTTEAGHALRARVVELADDILAQPPLIVGTSTGSADSDTESGSDIGGGGERAEWGLGRRWGADALLKAIDRGSYTGGRSGRASGSSILFCSFFLLVLMLMPMLLPVYAYHACVGFHTLPCYIVNRHVDTRSDRWDEGFLARWAIRCLPRAADRRAGRARRHRLPEPPLDPTPIPIVTPKQQRKNRHPRRREREPPRHRRAIHRGARTRRAPATPTRSVNLCFCFRAQYAAGGAPASS